MQSVLINCNIKFVFIKSGLIQLVNNCNYYSQDGECSECASGFILSNNECQAAQVQNCVEYVGSVYNFARISCIIPSLRS